MFHFKIKSRHFERVEEPSSLFPLSNYFSYISVPSLFFNLIFLTCLLQFLFPHLLPFHSPRMMYPVLMWCPLLHYSFWMTIKYKWRPYKRKKTSLWPTKTEQVEAQFSSCWSAFQGILLLNSIKSSNSKGGEGGECRGPEEEAPSMGSERSRGLVRLEA